MVTILGEQIMAEEFDNEEEECECDSMNNDEWIQKQSEYLKKIKKFKVKDKDRLHSISELSFMHKLLCDTALSWTNWVNGWVSIELAKKIDVKEDDMVTLTDEELKVLHKKYQNMVSNFIEMDIEITQSFTKRINEVNKKKAIAPAALCTPRNESKMVV